MPRKLEGTPDPARTLELLWRQLGHGQPARGPQQGRTVDEVIASAIEIADAAGLDGLSMRSVARSLAVAPMSIYTYVPGKTALCDLMLDSLYLAMPRPPFDGQDWRTRLTAVADGNRSMLLTHPWAAALTSSRPPLGPGLMAKYEHELTAFQGLGIGDVTTDDCLMYLLTFVQAAAGATADVHRTQRETAMNDGQWWAANAPLLSRVLDPERYPTAARIGTAAGEAHGSAYNAEHAYRFGLALCLDGIGAIIA